MSSTDSLESIMGAVFFAIFNTSLYFVIPNIFFTFFILNISQFFMVYISQYLIIFLIHLLVTPILDSFSTTRRWKNNRYLFKKIFKLAPACVCI